MNLPLISIIVPVYNVEPYFEKCIRSILSQTHENLEILLIDDGSTDASGNLCDAYGAKDSRIVVVHQPNGGQASARNRGISMAKGDYIGFVDSDDWIAPNMYEVLLSALQRNGCDIAVCGRFTVKGDAAIESQSFHLDEETVMNTEEAVKRFLTYRAIDSSSCDKLFKREVLKDVRYPLGYICEDVPFVFDALTRAESVVHCAKPLYYYFQRAGSTSKSAFAPKTMGLYYNFKDVRDRCLVQFPALAKDADFLYYKNLLVLASRIAVTKGKISERQTVNQEIRKNKKAILKEKRLKKTYRLLCWAILLHIERHTIRLARKFGVFVG